MPRRNGDITSLRVSGPPKTMGASFTVLYEETVSTALGFGETVARAVAVRSSVTFVVPLVIADDG
jgi:hypothetical protein